MRSVSRRVTRRKKIPQPGAWPWIAGLYDLAELTVRNFSNLEVLPFCGGVLVAAGAVLSAAHCYRWEEN